MTKKADTRLRETITFIENNPAAGSYAKRTFRVEKIRAWHASASADDRTYLSGLMSQVGKPHRPADKQGRACRRAAILLRCALAEPRGNWPATANAVNSSFAPASAYQGGCNQAWDGYWSDAVRAQVNLDRLCNDPLGFLQEFKLNINGERTASRYTYGFYMESGVYKLDCIQPGRGAVKIKALNVPATYYKDVEDPGALPAADSDAAKTSKLMLTTQFTGCCYCFMLSKDGRNLVAAHINPGGVSSKVTGKTVWRDMHDNGAFEEGNGGQFRAFGRLDDQDDSKFGYGQTAAYINIVAVRRHKKWEVYAQIRYADQTFEAFRIDQ